MDLFVIRHAIAEERREGRVDAERALTDKGKARFGRAVLGLRRLDVRFTEILTSPWRRASETADLLAPLSEREPLAVETLATPPGERLLEELTRSETGSVALVGHEPWLSELIAWLVVGDRDDGDPRFELKKGAVAHLEGSPRPGGMRLVSLMPPKLLRLAGG